MISTCVMVYLGAWLLTGAGTFVAGRLLAEPDGPVENRLLISIGAGAAWPFVLLGAAELSSVAVYARAKSMRTPRTVPGPWIRAGALDNVVPLR